MTSLNAQLKAIGPKQRQRKEGQREGRKGERGEGRDGEKKRKGKGGKGRKGRGRCEGRKEKMQSFTSRAMGGSPRKEAARYCACERDALGWGFHAPRV